VWSALPGEEWPRRLAEAMAATLASGRGAVAVVPDARDLARLDAALTAVLGKGHHVVLSASLGPELRYKRWLAVRRGAVRVVAGTRAASFAPVAGLGLVALWDDGDDLHAEPRSPYCHAREVLLVRAQLAGAGALLGGYVRTCEAQLLVETRWAQPLVADRATVRQRAPRVTPLGEDTQLARDAAAASARLPTVAWDAARAALKAGAPVLVQVPRRGYAPVLACGRCRGPARCTTCAGPLGTDQGQAVPGCRWCGRLAADWACPNCGARALRASVIGARRTAEELGRAFAGVPVRTSGREAVLDTVPAEPALVVATPGAEPVADGGYGAALLLDAWALLTRPDLRAAEETLRRWANAAALVRPDGQVVVTADVGVAVVQALVRWDPAGHAERELAERAELGFPPAAKMASVTGAPEAVAELIELAELPENTETLGPVPVAAHGDEEQERALLRVPRATGRALAASLHAALGVRSAKKAPHPVRVEMDPLELL
jgi:primosomal protein N' (replication factor Y)